jgi:hypothetical protein
LVKFKKLSLGFKQSVGKNLALLQAEVSACVSELVNVPNVRWLFFFCGSAKQKFHQICTVVSFFSLAYNV